VEKGMIVEPNQYPEIMNTFETAAFFREMKIMLEISLVHDVVDFDDSGLYYTYLEWIESKRWLIDLGRNELHCIN
jgi:hypothetical protein